MTITMDNFEPTPTVGLAIIGRVDPEVIEHLKLLLPGMIVIDPAAHADVDAVVLVVGAAADRGRAMEQEVMRLARADFESGAQLPFICISAEDASYDLTWLHPHLLSWVWTRLSNRRHDGLLDRIAKAAREKAVVHCLARKVRGISPL